MSEFNEELLFAEEDRQTVAFIQGYLPQEIKEKFTEDDLYYFLDAFAEYCETSGLMDNEDEEAEIDIEEAAIFMAKQAKKAIGAEIVEPAIRDAWENAERNQVKNVEFFCGDSADIAEKLEKDGLKPDVITVDPPRKGLAPEVIASVAGMGPKKVVYVSCDAATLGRDVKIFAGFGYKTVRACAVDMFPGTRHVEAVCLLEKSEEMDA